MPKHLLGLYKHALVLYPKQYRAAYGEQMVQTLEDMLADMPSRKAKTAFWLRTGFDLQRSLIEQNIRNIGETYMGTTNRLLACAAWIAVAAVAIVAFHALRLIGTDWRDLGGGLRVIGLLAFSIIFIGVPFLLAVLALFNEPRNLYRKFAGK
jgi:hypothetical protein